MRNLAPAALAVHHGARRSRTRKPVERPDRTELIIEERSGGSGVVLFLIGRLNWAGARLLETRVSEVVGRGEAKVVLDCAGMSYVNSMGLRTMLRGARTCQHEGGRLAIAGLQPECRSVVEMSGFLSVIEYHETSEAALSALK